MSDRVCRCLLCLQRRTWAWSWVGVRSTRALGSGDVPSIAHGSDGTSYLRVGHAWASLHGESVSATDTEALEALYNRRPSEVDVEVRRAEVADPRIDNGTMLIPADTAWYAREAASLDELDVPLASLDEQLRCAHAPPLSRVQRLPGLGHAKAPTSRQARAFASYCR